MIRKNHGTEIVVANLGDKAKAFYDPTTGKLYISSRIGTGEAMRQALVHELMHSIEGSGGYAAYKDAVMQAAYHGDKTDMRHDVERIREVYEPVYEREGRTFTDADAESELVGIATEKVIEKLAGWTKTGGETQIYDLLGEKQRLGVRLYNHLTQFIAKVKAKMNGKIDEYNELVRARDALKEALKGAKGAQKNKERQYALVDIGENSKGVYESNFEQGTSKDEKRRRVIELWQKVWSRQPIELNIVEGGKPRTITASFDPDYDPANIRMTDLGKMLHSKNGSAGDRNVTLNLADDLYDLARTSNYHSSEAEQGKDSDTHKNVKTWHYFFNDILYRGEKGDVPYTVWMDVKEKNQGGWVYQLYARKTKEKAQLEPYREIGPVNRQAMPSSDTSIAQSEIGVNPHDTQNGTKYALELNQFDNKTAQQTDALVDQIKQQLLGGRHEKQVNRDQVERANAQYDSRGAEAMMAELNTREMWTAEDMAAAQVAIVRGQNDGHLVQAAQLAQMYSERISKAGQALQAGSIFKKLTASGAMAESLDRANRANRRQGLADGTIPMGNEAPVKGWKERQAKAETDVQTAARGERTEDGTVSRPAAKKAVDAYEAAERTQKAAQSAEGSETVSTDNPLHIPLSGAQTALIDRFGLWNTKLPGYDYFRASLKERMLAAIIATPNNSRGDGLLTLCQQLEFMQRGYAVVTEADLNYITGEMATFQLLEADNETPQTAEGRTVIQRIYSAQANTKPNGLWGKWNNLGYDNMLSSPKTWNKNVMSNILTRPLEMASEGVAAVADRMVAKKTGNRTTGLPGREGVSAGHRAFAEEIANTLTDYVIRGTDTGHSSSFDFNNNSRTYNNAFMQTYHDFIAMAMQLGDRPFWEQCYAEETDVLKRLNTQIQDTRATADGNTELFLRDMTDEERSAEAARRATERVFQEDNVLIDSINDLKRKSRAADVVITALMPFLKTPTNVAIRAMQYSPVGLAYTLVRDGLIAAKTEGGAGFDQRKFVMNLGRGLTGTGMMVVGMALASAGFIKPGREDEEDSRLSAIEKSNGKSYGMYFDVFGTEIPPDFAFPAVAPWIIGAQVAQAVKDHEGSGDGAALSVDIAKKMAAASIDQLCDNSMLQGVSSIFRGYKDNAAVFTAVAEGVAENTASRLTPASIRAVAKFTDPYVRDTKSQNYLTQVLNAQIIQNWPILRQTLPKAQTLTGEDMLQTGANSWGKDRQNAALHFLNSFITPWTAGSETTDAVLDELTDLAYRTDETSFLPAALVGGNKYDVTVTQSMAKAISQKGVTVGKVGLNKYESVTFHLTDEEKRWLNGTYADALFNGSGRKVTGLRALTASRKWQRMSDEEKMSAVKEEAAKAKQAVLEEMVRRRK